MSSRSGISAAVFAVGTATLIVEIVFMRVLAPYFGSTLYVTSSVIGIVLGALAAGYVIGGRVADRRPDTGVFWLLVTLAGITILITTAAASVLLPLLAPLGLRVGAILASAILLTPQNLFLGTLTPHAIRILADDPSRFGAVGRIAGNVFFFSTLGSIAGAMLAGFVLIPRFGTLSILIAVGVILLAGGILGRFRQGARSVPFIIVGAILIPIAVGVTVAPEPDTTRVIVESSYAQLRVEDTSYEGRDARILVTDRNAWGGIFLDTGEPAFAYMRVIVDAIVALPKPPESVLVVGAGPYSIPQELHRRFPDARITVVDIDPALLPIAETWFAIEGSAFETIVEDGRRFLARDGRRFDVIVLDAFSGFFSIPAHLTTREFFRVVRDRLAPDGLVVLNSVSVLPDGAELLGSLFKTFADSFPDAHLVPVGTIRLGEPQNFLIASGSPPPAVLTRRDLRAIVPQGFILADAYAPVETMVLSAVRAAAR